MRKDQIRQQAYNRQRAQFSQALNSLSAEEKARLSTLPKDEQVCTRLLSCSTIIALASTLEACTSLIAHNLSLATVKYKRKKESATWENVRAVSKPC